SDLLQVFMPVFPCPVKVRSVLTAVGFWMVRFPGFSDSCCLSTLTLELGLFSSRDLGLMSSFRVRPLPSSITLTPASSLDLARTGSWVVCLPLLAFAVTLLGLQASLVFLACLRRVGRLRGFRDPAGILLGERPY
ncbi:hypothetical protein H1C71_013351, partial [Ictidomys tridecemlineatus]